MEFRKKMRDLTVLIPRLNPRALRTAVLVFLMLLQYFTLPQTIFTNTILFHLLTAR